MPSQEGNGGKISAGKLGKSEKDAYEVALAAKDDELKKNEAAMMELVALIAKPLRKSVKGISELSFLSKEGVTSTEAKPLTKSEITGILREKARDASLKKSDRDLISKFTVGAVDQTKIEHLLK
jgi:hypothetical protein